MHFYFIDTNTYEMHRVTARDMSAAWTKYIDHMLATYPEFKKSIWGDRPYGDIRKDIEHDVFVLTEDQVKEL